MLSGTIRNNFRSDLGIRATWYATQDESNNQTNITCDFFVDRMYSMYASFDVSADVNGTKKSTTYRIETSSGGNYKVLTVKTTVRHNSEGKANFYIKADFNFRGLSLSGGAGIYHQYLNSGNIAIDDIKRLAISDFKPMMINTSDSQVIHITNYKYSDAYCGVYIGKEWIKTYELNEIQNNRFTLSFTESEVNKILDNCPNTARPLLSLWTWTMENNKLVGTTYNHQYCTVDTKYKPWFGSITVKDNNTKNKTTNLLINASDISVIVPDNVRAGRGATIKDINYICEIEGREVWNTHTTSKVGKMGKATKMGKAIFKVWVTDSRGYKTLQSKETYISFWTPPSLSDMRVYRADSQGKLSVMGTGANITGKIIGETVSGENPITVSIYYKAENASSWTKWDSYTITNTAWHGEYDIYRTKTHGFDLSTGYNIKIVVSDLFSSSEYIGEISSAKPMMVYSKNKITVGGFPTNEPNNLELFGEIGIDGKIHKIHSNTINLPLLNGWNGYIKGVQDPFGNFHIWANIRKSSNPRNWEVIAKIPQNYPLETGVAITTCDSNEISNSMYISNNGNIFYVFGVNGSGKFRTNSDYTFYTVIKGVDAKG